MSDGVNVKALECDSCFEVLGADVELGFRMVSGDYGVPQVKTEGGLDRDNR